ncbi:MULTISPECIES: M17 family metallopeptidase [unclassified Oleiphilus]|jgi:leucyl aminopeptidase|nr:MULTISPECIES: leucyl aminopeptidase family protein [unclassified Oleiphilus]KZY42759.1 leucyl aminopeptidase [Oleiphilus sp. HI0050]KZY77660.1 leucyl aminopeptidase [Oleiphilus sp. HI0068]KZY81016.1 leucyl aminopeptidase [Oleiphilus sp. HI0069]KZY96930.1 leucyl aminopeptidase [Oleiphilus sp. HI0072]KZZ21094.1 leucyl aminopeptidase [Oleiphilus sp. HI0081]KZZ42763.1 leucyl aminopeptidase [Oleiphilus sp. HI0085]
MNEQFPVLEVSNQESTAIVIINSEHYENWVAKQAENIKTWLNANNYEGKGGILIPDSDGSALQCIYGMSPKSDYFIAGDLALQIPAARYSLDCSQCSELFEDQTEFETQFAITWALSCYRYTEYKKNDKSLPTLSVSSEAILNKAQAFSSSVSLVRDLINTPASDLMPEDMGTVAEQLAEQYGAKLEQFVGDQLLEHNYPTIHAVGRASVHEPRLIDLTWGDEDAPKITLVGKGVCFDSGGLDLKPSNAMRLMKKDMGGAAHVLGLAKLIMDQALPIRLRVLIPAVENAVSSNAFRPGDVITTRQGITVEIDNTDAEGRLVLCDALTEADSENPDMIFDFATLTGACRVALGTELPGFFCNDEQLASSLQECGKSSQDLVWQLPLHSPYQDMLKSDIADTLNSAATGFGGAITAALYLQLFVSDDTPWVHFDVMAWNNRKLPGRPTGGEAFGIRAVFDLLEQRFNK